MNYTLTHDAVGNMTDDGKDYKFVYDALGRLKTVKNQSNTVVAEYTYNGLNMRIGWHYDADADADVDGSDPWYNFAHDDRWRIVATFRGSDTSPKELFAYHAAGGNGRGSSSYIDSVILRNKDANTSWTSASDATLEERLYYVQNWRADVSAILTSAGLVKEWIKYTSYGIPVRIDPGDYNRDGFVNGADFDDYSDDFDNARSEADVNFDTAVNGDDYDLFSEWWDAPSTAGRFTLSASSVANRIGYAGYQYDPTFVGASRAVFHVRNRVYDAGLGRWTRRDPAGYVDGSSLYAFLAHPASGESDPLGLCRMGFECSTNTDVSTKIADVDEDEDDYKSCCDWFNREITNTAWMLQLPSCPCNRSAPELKDENKWDSEGESDYHAEAAECFRSAPVPNKIGAPGQQCCYDNDGALITDGTSAGTPDRVSPFFPLYQNIIFHWINDVRPFDKCKNAGCLGNYMAVRTPNKGAGDGCTPNMKGDPIDNSCTCEAEN